jgi:adenosylcobinamide kinase / adenosylcobinamide-phosphate guanylyltransferase
MHITLITGGARSGKSDYAQKLAVEQGAATTFIATAEAGDADMAGRIEKHRAARPTDWITIESRDRVADALRAATTPAVIIDCVTLLVSNVMLAAGGDAGVAPQSAPRPVQPDTATHSNAAGREHPARGADLAVQSELDDLIAVARARDGSLIIVTNEVGLGVVPATELGRRYRDLLGSANRALASAADDVVLMVSGIPVRIKESREAGR